MIMSLAQNQCVTNKQKAHDLEDENKEYKKMINFVTNEYEKRNSYCNDYVDIIHYMDDYYEDVLQKLSPRYVMKHVVKNDTRGKFLSLFDTSVASQH